MKKRNLNDIARLEKAIAKKYGKRLIKMVFLYQKNYLLRKMSEFVLHASNIHLI